MYLIDMIYHDISCISWGAFWEGRGAFVMLSSERMHAVWSTCAGSFVHSSCTATRLMTCGRSAARKQVRQQRPCSLLPVLPLWAAHACAEVLPTRTLGWTSCLHKCTPCPAWVCELTQPRAPLQGRSDSVADGDGCSCSLELGHSSAPVRRIRLRLGHRHHGREERAHDAYLVALVGPLTPSMSSAVGSFTSSITALRSRPGQRARVSGYCCAEKVASRWWLRYARWLQVYLIQGRRKQ
jgi:hypothetical protein